jgi:hypothetical protein
MATTTAGSLGELQPTTCGLLEVRVAEPTQLFNVIDPSPFRERDLDPDAEAFIVDWARETSTSAVLGLAVHLDRPGGGPNEADELRDAIHEFFRRRAARSRRRLRELFRRGRASLAIGFCALGVSLAAGNLIGHAVSSNVADLFKEGLLIGGWVAMWRPIEIFLYDWWPLSADSALADRLSVMPVRIAYTQRSGGVAG